MTQPDYLARNRAFWDGQAHAYAEAGERSWSEEPSWGIWDVPEAELGLLPADMTGLDANPYPFVDRAWGSAWPSEEIWKARKRR